MSVTSTGVQAIQQLLAAEWEPTISGRSTDVPEPTIVEENDEIQELLRTTDVIYIVDGQQDRPTGGFGDTHESSDEELTVQVHTADRRDDSGLTVSGRHRLDGERQGAFTEPDRWAGVAGEALRILRDHRKGFAEYDRVIASDVIPQNDLVGANRYRGDIDVLLKQYPETIDTSV